MRNLNLDVDSPEKLPGILENAASAFEDSASELAAAWQDRNAGKIWEDFAKIMERAANDCRKALSKRGL